VSEREARERRERSIPPPVISMRCWGMLVRVGAVTIMGLKEGDVPHSIIKTSKPFIETPFTQSRLYVTLIIVESRI
jgi:hypothetical protein